MADLLGVSVPGPLTNLALALQEDPESLGSDIGSAEGGRLGENSPQMLGRGFFPAFLERCEKTRRKEMG